MIAISSKAFRLSWTAASMAVWLAVGCNEISGAARIEVVDSVDAGDGGDANAPSEDADTSPRDAAKEAAESDAGPGVKYVFVTSDSFSGDLGGRDGADLKCTLAAADAGLPGEWMAWLSVTDRKAIDRITHQGPYHLLNEAEVVADPIELRSGSISHAINVTEHKVELTTNRGVWTGTRPNGSVDQTCVNWTSASNSDTGTMASALATDNGWTKGTGPGAGVDFWPCDSVVSLYCFEK